MNMTNGVFLLLGTNLGDKWANLGSTLDQIERYVGHIIKASSVFESEPWGNFDQPDFLNQVLMIDTKLNPPELLTQIQSIERQLGRYRIKKWEARLIDIDILYYNDLLLNTGDLIIPHPLIQQRKFTLLPLAEIAPDLLHPVLQKSTKQMLIDCCDNRQLKIAKTPREV